MKEQLLQIAKPILFNTKMVKAILDGRKTQTRRVIKNDYLGMADIEENNIYVPREDGGYINILNTTWSKYKVGDILYVKETFAVKENGRILYKADYEDGFDIKYHWRTEWSKSIHLKQKDARIFLKVTNVIVERLQDIKYSDIEKEVGVDADNYKQYTSWSDLMACDFKDTWNSNAKDGYKWEDNPYVFVYEFEKVEIC